MSKTTDGVDIHALRALLEAATPRPWSEGRAGNCSVVHFDGDDVRGVAAVANVHNAALICAAVNALPALLAVYEAACALRDDRLFSAMSVSEIEGGGVRVRLITAVDAARKEGK